MYVTLLAVSSLLHAWGSAGAYTFIAESLPEDGDRVNGYAILSTFTQRRSSSARHSPEAWPHWSAQAG